MTVERIGRRLLSIARPLRVSPEFEWRGWKEKGRAEVYDLVVTRGSYELWRSRFASPGLTKRFEECLLATGRAVGLDFVFRTPFKQDEYIGSGPLLREVAVLEFENGPRICLGLNPRFNLQAEVTFKDDQAWLNSQKILWSLAKCRGVKPFGLKGKVGKERLSRELAERAANPDEFAAPEKHHRLVFEIGSSKGNRTLINFLERTKEFWNLGGRR
ncbi:MAG TPA: hypothetical protein VMW04_00725 [Patescibacteria group bacterium]|nr:hypothetical protein [Patescibacteria group bacterium]